MEAIQNLFVQLHLNTPVKRFAAASVATGAGLVAIQPELMFEAGVPRPWAVIAQQHEEGAVTPTQAPWWLVSVGAGLVAAQFF